MKNIIKTLFFVMIIILSHNMYSQDIIIKKDGTEVNAKVTEITSSEVKYKKHENLNGPAYSVSKSEIFMIRYENGSKDVFKEQSIEQNTQGYTISNQNGTEDKNCTIIFYRQKKALASGQKIIIGSPHPDTVFVKLKSGTYHKFVTSDIREWNFIGGIYSLSAPVSLELKARNTYYFNCWIKSSFPANKAVLELVNENTGIEAIKKLKELY